MADAMKKEACFSMPSQTSKLCVRLPYIPAKGVNFQGRYCTMSQSILRGQLYYADLNPVIGSEQGGIRPVLVIQNDIGNRHSQSISQLLPILDAPHRMFSPWGSRPSTSCGALRCGS